MNQVGRDAWHLHMQYIVDGVTRFVNRMNRNYTGEGIGMNPTQFPNFLFPGLPPAINTCVYNNAFEISIGIVSSSLDREDLNDVHNSAIEDIEDPTDDDDDGTEGAVGGVPAHKGDAPTARRDTPTHEGDAPPAGGDAPAPPSSPRTQKHQQAKELMRTLSSAMEKPYWDTCQKTDRDPCLMPNIAHTPDIAVTLNPQNYTQNLTYPIFIGEILGKKDKGALYSQRYAGYNATMQSLVFSPRAYYWEIGTLSPSLYILKKDPAHGRIKTNMKTYHLQDPAQYDQMLKDLCDVFLDELINLHPISYISGKCMRAKEYKDFISKPSGLGHPIENQCWHLFVPKYNCQGIQDMPPDYHKKVDAGDKNKPFVPQHGASHVPSIEYVVEGNKVIEVDQLKIRECDFADVEHCRAYRDKSGNAKDLKDMDMLQYIRSNVKDLSKQTALSDISNLLSRVFNARFFTLGFIKQIKASEPEVDPAPETLDPEDGNIWELNTFPHGMECRNMQDTTLNMLITFHEDDDYEDPEHILDDEPTPKELMIEEEQEQVEQLTERMAALQMPGGAATPVSTPRGTTQVSTTGQFLDPSLLLQSNTVKLAPSASEALKIFLSRTPVPDNLAPNTWSPSKGLPTTRQQARIAEQYMVAMSSSPGMVTRGHTTRVTGATQARSFIAGGKRPTPPTPTGRVTPPTAGERGSTTHGRGSISGGRELAPTTQWGRGVTPPTAGGRGSTSGRGSAGGRVSASGGIAD